VALDAAGHRPDEHVRGAALTEGGTPGRQRWIDWARGLAVCAMVLAHVLDSWTRDADRANDVFHAARFVGGLAAPAFLFLAGLSLALAATRAARRDGSHAAGAAIVWRRGWQIFALAFLFRLQSMVLGFGAPIGLLKVDILNVMGLAMVAAAALWRPLAGPLPRALLFAGATVACALAAPLVWASEAVAALPGPFAWYLQPTPGRSNFTLLPWTGFLLSGVIAGELVASVRDAAAERRAQAALLLTGALALLVSNVTASQPSLYPSGVSSYWGPSPAFFLLRLALVVLVLPAAWAHLRAWHGGGAVRLLGRAGQPLASALRPLDDGLVTLGRSSLFAYWVHVEVVYGLIAYPIKHTLPLWLVLLATVLLCVLLHRAVGWKDRWVGRRRIAGAPAVV
jgi:uncharacterized membrane protein